MDLVLRQGEQVGGGEGPCLERVEHVDEPRRRGRIRLPADLVGGLTRHAEDLLDEPFGHRGDGEVGRRRQGPPLLAVGGLRLDGDAPPGAGVGPEVRVNAPAVSGGLVGDDRQQWAGIAVEDS